MNSQTESDAINKINRIVLGILLLFVIAGAGVYGSMKFMEIYQILAVPQKQYTVVTKLNEDEKITLLASVASSDADVEESERLKLLRDLAIQGNLDVKKRTAILDSLK